MCDRQRSALLVAIDIYRDCTALNIENSSVSALVAD